MISYSCDLALKRHMFSQDGAAYNILVPLHHHIYVLHVKNRQCFALILVSTLHGLCLSLRCQCCHVGGAIPGTQLRVVHPETRDEVADGQQGVILARGPGVMSGYFDNPSATAAAFVEGEGWFDTGDLGWRAPKVHPSFLSSNIVKWGRVRTSHWLCFRRRRVSDTGSLIL